MIDISKLAKDGSFLSFDIEGDGNSGQRPVELSFCQFNENGFVEEHYFLIDPERPINTFAISKHGLTDAMVQGRDTIRDVAERIRELVSDQMLVGHSSIDDVHLISTGIPDFLLLPKAILDTQRIARRLAKLRKETIPEALSRFAVFNGIDPHDAPASLARRGLHSASTDAWLTGQVFRAAMPLLPDDYTSKKQYPEMLSVKVSDARRREIEDKLLEQAASMKP
ncbi:3'-5' exonuclease [Rhizobium sp. MHM7A]|uniref:3'-5' exonuclease n=1 Tax=Rhizobium sp. MHM7A TaxID=2583233 RepID=UPI00110726D1|nr:3'-5' exonuclease [Rhizobium sp. MHM7A]TLX15822.1 3'-5' exonuclease [Rhizobium sp. MHM7A]